MLNVSESQKKVLIAWAFLGIIILVLVSIVAISTVHEKEVKEDEGITLLNSKKVIDRSRYYTVKNAITKYYSYVNMKDFDSVLKILDSKYIEDNKISVDNLKDYITDSNINLSYDSKIMCLKDSNKGVYTFVVDGDEISANTGKFVEKKQYEIIMDGNNSTFSLKPIDKSQYDEVCNG